MNNLILCGFMGCGKTTVGRILASRLGFRHIDMDHWIEQREGTSVPEIFQQRGEPYFRRLEEKAAKELSKFSGCVISTGGGAVLNPEIVRVFRSGGMIIHIDVPLKVIKYRLTGNTGRPLLDGPAGDDHLLRLYESRLPAYRRAADLTIHNPNNLSAERVAHKIILLLKRKRLFPC
ncbi:MAG TPA: shikimate kinase [Clostridia bacterium]|nr:shikimate kinase [Clostridia bacterium]